MSEKNFRRDLLPNEMAFEFREEQEYDRDYFVEMNETRMELLVVSWPMKDDYRERWIDYFLD